ncbi:MAG: hypothetical protein IT539_06465 [Bradyrhizobiaceae bacterium]|nr:hypothetical protein [Bradyrhizobiaceae bacterium]
MTSAIHRSFIGLFGISLCAGTAYADPLPIPSADYSVKATMTGGMTMISRHSRGKLRVDMQPPGMPQPMVAYFDLRTRKGVSVMSVPGMAPMAMEMELDSKGGHGVATGSGRRVGSATIAGERCDLWRIEPTNAEEKSADTVSCVTADGIPLRVEATVNGKRETIFQATEVSRAPIDAKLMTPPSNVKPMQLPKGMMPPIK